MIDVSVVIIHYNTPELTYNCLASIFKKTNSVSFEVIVVDNASTIHNYIELEKLFPKITLIRSEKNLGFAGGNNLGLKCAKGRFILLLNSDTELINNAIKITYDYLVSNKKIGAVSAQLQFPDGRIQSVCQRFPSIRYQLFELLRLQKVISNKISGRILLGAFFNHKECVRADWVWGAFMMLPSHVIRRMPNAKLDEKFFMYTEDVQWCLDIKRLGYEVHYFPSAKVIHYMGSSGGSKTSLMKQNNERFLKDNYSFIHRFLINVIGKVLNVNVH